MVVWAFGWESMGKVEHVKKTPHFGNLCHLIAPVSWNRSAFVKPGSHIFAILKHVQNAVTCTLPLSQMIPIFCDRRM